MKQILTILALLTVLALVACAPVDTPPTPEPPTDPTQTVEKPIQESNTIQKVNSLAELEAILNAPVLHKEELIPLLWENPWKWHQILLQV